MPKRPISELECEDSRLQSKIHVGLKEINRGICADFNMKAVYQKTLHLLFHGLKPTNSVAETTSVPPSVLPSKYNQMTITLNGSISNKPSEEVADVRPATSPAGQCHSCRKANSPQSDKCRFCEKLVCEGCRKPCAACGGDYCSKCSMKIYSREDLNMCFSCATERGGQHS